MDYRKLIEAALERAKAAQTEARSVAESTDLSDDEKRSKIEALTETIEMAQEEARDYIERAEREKRTDELFARVGNLNNHAGANGGQRQGADLNAELRAIANGEQREMVVRGRVGEYRTAVTTDSSSNTIPTMFMTQVIEALRESSPIFGLSRVITTSSGEPMEWPKLTEHTTLEAGGTWKPGENTAFSKANNAWDKMTLGATKYGVIVEISRELIEDSEIDIASFVARDAGVEIGRQVSTDAVAKLLADVNPGVTVASGGDFATDDLLAMYHSLVTGYRANAQWLMNDATALRLRKFKDTMNQYIWQPGMQAGQPDLLLARAVHTDYNMPVLPTGAAGTTAEVIAFGDFSKFIIRQVNDLRIVRSDEYGFDRDVVAFKVTWRGDFGLSDTAAIKSLVTTV